MKFLEGIQKAGVKADFPPTEAQLVKYFKTLGNDPAAARQALEDYAQNFHLHPGHVVNYSHAVPEDWSEVFSHPASGAENIDRQQNDCKGFAFMADKLLKAAGFTVVHHVDAFPGPNNEGHEMVMFTHPPEKGYTLTSNDKVFTGNNQKELAKQGFENTPGTGGTASGVHFYIGDTAADARRQMADQGRQL